MVKVTDEMVARATQEYLSHKGERPSRILRGGMMPWETCARAMRAALEAALAVEDARPQVVGSTPDADMIERIAIAWHYYDGDNDTVPWRKLTSKQRNNAKRFVRDFLDATKGFVSIKGATARPQAVEGMEPVASIVPDGCSGSAFAFDPGVLHVNKDGSGYIAVDEERWELEDDRCVGPDGPDGSVHWITKISADDMEELRDFLNGAPRAVALAGHAEITAEMNFLRAAREKAERERDEFRSALGTTSGRHFLADSRAKCAEATLAQKDAEIARIVSTYGGHTSACGWCRGHDCDCGLDSLRAVLKGGN